MHSLQHQLYKWVAFFELCNSLLRKLAFFTKFFIEYNTYRIFWFLISNSHTILYLKIHPIFLILCHRTPVKKKDASARKNQMPSRDFSSARFS
jgi:hypothetical protein